MKYGRRLLFFITISSALFIRAQYIPFAFFAAGSTVTPATFIQEAEVAWNGAGPNLTTASFNVQAGDVLVAYAVKEGEADDISISGGSLSWFLYNYYDTDNKPGYDITEVRMWAATVDSNKAMTVTFTNSNTNGWFGGNVLTFRGSGGIGATAKNSQNPGIPSVNLTTVRSGSRVVVVSGDWNAVNGSGRAWLSAPTAPTEVSYHRDATHYAAYGAYYGNVGAAGSKTVGLSGPSGQRYAIIALEVLGDTTYDHCSGTPVTGLPCPGGTVYVGQFQGGHYMTTPGGCTNSSTPTCNNSTDTLLKTFHGTAGWRADVPEIPNASENVASSQSLRGYIATQILVSHSSVGSDSAADYCNDMVYGGYSDWYLPSKSELVFLFCKSSYPIGLGGEPSEDPLCATTGGPRAVTGFNSGNYWSSGESHADYGIGNSFYNGYDATMWKSDPASIRCVRRYYSAGLDVTPDLPINWADFTGTSSAVTISGIDTNITLDISAANGVGAPTLAYRKNGGAWTVFTTIVPASVSVLAGDILEFSVSGTAGDSATITVTNTSDSNSILDTVLGNVVVCPTNYVNVPANTDYVGSNFCAMKYEAKAETNGGGSYDADGTGVVLANFKPASIAANVPWRNISRDDSRLECQSLGAGYDLISNAQWQTIARNIELQNSNWTGGTVGSGCIFQGNNGETNCGYDGSDPSASSTNARGIHRLSTGSNIYDISGNITEWMRDDNSTIYGSVALWQGITTATHTTTGTLSDGVARSAKAQFGPQGTGYSGTNSSGLGRAVLNVAGGTVYRGGNPGSTSWGGVFAVNLTNAGTYTDVYAGFRCVYSPSYDSTAVDIAPTAINWANFNNLSTSQTLTGFNAPITLQISALNGTGTPTLEYRKNGGPWISYTTGSPATTVVESGDFIEHQVSGTVSHTATITVTNVTNGNTVLDTAVGTVL